MGNTLVSWNSGEEGTWSLHRLICTIIWIYFVLLVVFTYIMKKPWGFTSRCKRAIQRSEKKRSDGFSMFKLRVETNDETILDARKTILSWPLFQLIENLQNDYITATDALEAYVWKALSVQSTLNCCSEVIRELFLAFDTAQEAEEKWAKKDTKPPLYGIPFSVKGNFFIPGYDCCIGLAKWLDQPKSEECSFVTHLKNLGAIPFVITNVPQGLLSFACSNTVYGTTCNPHDITRTPGGSSGGEGALLAAGAVPFGIGSDLAGSLRIPAAFCGFVTLKPTQDRLVVTGTHGGIPGRGRLGLSFGFLTHSVDEQVALLDLIVGKPEYRAIVPLSVPAVLNMEGILSPKKLTIGYFDNDGFCTPIPAVRRCVLETVERLKCEGHELVQFTVPDINLMVDMFFKLLMPDGGSYICSVYENDIVDPLMKQFVMMLKIPHCIRWFASLLLNPISPQLATLCKAYVSDLEDLRYTQEQCDEYRKKFIAYWKGLGIDALVCPAFPVPAVPHHYPSKLGMTGVATGIFNFLDFPAGVVPTGKVTKRDDEELLDESIFPVGYNIALMQMREAAMNSVGLPLAVQVATLPFEEEVCLHVMSEVEKIWKK